MNIKLITNLCRMNKVQIKVSGPNVSFFTRANVSFFGQKCQNPGANVPFLTRANVLGASE